MEETTTRILKQQAEEEPFARKLGIKVLEVKPGYALVEMVCTREMENIFRMTHGGAIFTLIDEAFELSCNSHGTVAVALNVNVTYHRGPTPEARLRAEAREVNRTRSTGSYHIRVTDHDDRLIATCQALAFRKGEKLPFLEK